MDPFQQASASITITSAIPEQKCLGVIVGYLFLFLSCVQQLTN